MSHNTCALCLRERSAAHRFFFWDIASHPPCDQKSAFKRRCISVIARKLWKTGIVRSFAIVPRAPCSLTSGARPGIDTQIFVCIQRSNADRDICKHKMQNQALRRRYNFCCADKLQLMTYSLLNATLNTLADFHRVFVCGHFSSTCLQERPPL